MISAKKESRRSLKSEYLHFKKLLISFKWDAIYIYVYVYAYAYVYVHIYTYLSIYIHKTKYKIQNIHCYLNDAFKFVRHISLIDVFKTIAT